MKRARLLRALAGGLVAVAAVVGYWWWRAPQATRIKVGQPAPELQLFSIGSAAPTRLSRFRGRPVLLTMFVDECPACQDAVSRIERLHREFGGRGLVVLGVSADVDPVARARSIEKLGVTFIVLQDPGGIAIKEAYGTSRLPELYVIDPQGTVQAVYLGRLGEKQEELRARVEAMLASPAAG